MRADEDFLLGLAQRIERQGYNVDSDAITIRERSTIFGMLRRWPECERRRKSGPWVGLERRASMGPTA